VVAILKAKVGAMTATVGWQLLGAMQLQVIAQDVMVSGVRQIEDFCKDTKMFHLHCLILTQSSV